MKVMVLTSAAVALCVAVGAFALHFELNVRTHTYHELSELRGQARTDLDSRRISASRDSTLDAHLHKARIDLEHYEVGVAQ